MKKIAVLAITKNGIKMSLRIKEHFSDFEIFAPIKFSDNRITMQEKRKPRKILPPSPIKTFARDKLKNKKPTHDRAMFKHSNP